MALPTVEELLSKDIFELLNIEEASEERKAAVLKAIADLVDTRVVNRLANMMSDDDAKEFGRLAESGEKEKLIDFLVKKEIDLPVIVSEEATRARVEIAELVRLATEK